VLTLFGEGTPDISSALDGAEEIFPIGASDDFSRSFACGQPG